MVLLLLATPAVPATVGSAIAQLLGAVQAAGDGTPAATRGAARGKAALCAASVPLRVGSMSCKPELR